MSIKNLYSIDSINSKETYSISIMQGEYQVYLMHLAFIKKNN